MYRFNAIPIKIPMAFFKDRKNNPELAWDHKRP